MITENSMKDFSIRAFYLRIEVQAGVTYEDIQSQHMKIKELPRQRQGDTLGE